jgi:hypothetical protein
MPRTMKTERAKTLVSGWASFSQRVCGANMSIVGGMLGDDGSMLLLEGSFGESDVVVVHIGK